ncbi:ATPase assembly factor ATP10 [Gongronella butleri]|nr:ATPase assembly factor ATP10 [Gongronella butleri]
MLPAARLAARARPTRPILVRPFSTKPEAPVAPQAPQRGTFRPTPSILGLREPPVVDKQSWLQRKKQKIKDFTDYEKAFAAHAAERRHLVEEATKSYFADAHEMRKHGGKMYFAPTQLTKPEKSGYMPDFEGSDLQRQTTHTTDKLLGNITLMSFVYAKFGEDHVNSFINPFLAKFKDVPGVQTLEVNVQENYLKQYILKAFVPSIRKSLPAERADNYVLLYKDIKKTRKMLDMTNEYIGYVFLIDQDCKIRWMAHGDATPEEIANMLAMTKYLSDKRS